MKVFRGRILHSDENMNEKLHQLERIERIRNKLFGTPNILLYPIIIESEENEKNKNKEKIK